MNEARSRAPPPTCFSEISSIASAKSLPMKPDRRHDERADAGDRAEAHRLHEDDRDDDRVEGASRATIARAGQLTHGGMRLRAARSPMGSESTMPRKVASTAISRDSARPVKERIGLGDVRGNMRAMKRARCRGR
jgi:hypothetical protein